MEQRSEEVFVYESEKAIVRIHPGPNSDTPEKRRALLEPAVIKFAEALCRKNPELFKSTRPINDDEK